MSIRILKLILLLFLSLAAYSVAGTAIAQNSSVAVVDVHTHLVPGPGMRFDRSLANAVRIMDRFGIATSILMSPPRVRGIKQNYDIEDFRAAVKKYPGRFVYLGGGGTLNPTLHFYRNPSKVTDKVRRAFAAQARRLVDQGANGFGEIGGLHISLSPRHGYTYVRADHPLLKILADVAAERDLPLDLHMDAVASQMKPPAHLARLPNNPKKFPATLGALENLLSYNRKAKIVWAHGGTDHLGDFSAATIGGLMDKHPNLYVSLKVSGPRARTQNKLFSPGALDSAWRSVLSRHSDRFVIGTDNFYADPKGSGPTIEFSKRAPPRLQATGVFLSLLPADLAQKIGRDNALRLYRLTTTQAPAEISVSPLVAPAPMAPAPAPGAAGRGLCKDGNMAHCRIACRKGFRKACARLKRGR